MCELIGLIYSLYTEARGGMGLIEYIDAPSDFYNKKLLVVMFLNPVNSVGAIHVEYESLFSTI